MKKFILLFTSLILIASCTTNNTSTGTTSTTSTNTTTSTTETTPIEITTTGPTYGNGKAKLEIFSDFQCPGCQQHDLIIAPTLEQLASEGLITIIYRQYPLSFHINATGDSLAAMCAFDQNKYMEYKKEMYALEIAKKNAPVTNEERINIAKNLGLDTETFTTCLTSKKYSDYIKNDIQMGNNYKIPGTPTYVLDGKIFEISNFKANTNEELLEQIRIFFTAYNQKNS